MLLVTQKEYGRIHPCGVHKKKQAALALTLPSFQKQLHDKLIFPFIKSEHHLIKQQPKRTNCYKTPMDYSWRNMNLKPGYQRCLFCRYGRHFPYAIKERRYPGQQRPLLWCYLATVPHPTLSTSLLHGPLSGDHQSHTVSNSTV